MLQSVPVVSPLNCLVMRWLGILSDTLRVASLSSLYPSCFIILPSSLGLSKTNKQTNKQCSNNMSQREREKKGWKSNKWLEMGWYGVFGARAWAFFFFLWRVWDSYRSCGWIRGKLVPVGKVVTDGCQVINWDKNRKWKENKGAD